MRRSAVAALFALAMLAGAACGPSPEGSNDGDGSTGDGSTSTGDGSTSTGDADQEAREARVLSDAAAVQDLLDQFWTQELSAIYGMTFDPPDAFTFYRGGSGNQPCGESTTPQPQNAFYCYVNSTEAVQFDMDWLSGYLIEHPGDATTFLILAHEWGHAVQDTWMEQDPGADTWDPPYRQELNADCLAGVFLSRSIADGTILEEAGDADAIWTWLYEGGSAAGWLDPGTHGTSDQRQFAFSEGYLQGTAYCRVTY